MESNLPEIPTHAFLYKIRTVWDIHTALVHFFLPLYLKYFLEKYIGIIYFS